MKDHKQVIILMTCHLKLKMKKLLITSRANKQKDKSELNIFNLILTLLLMIKKSNIIK